jgi:hypothetical protein
MIARAAQISPIRRILSGFYDRAVQGVIREVSSVAGTISLIARNSYADGSFVPGISDIDTLVVVGDDLDLSELRRVMLALQEAHGRLRSLFPMLDPFTVYTRRGFLLAYQLGPLRAETYAWRCLWGKDFRTVLLHYDVSEMELAARAVQTYLTGYHANLRTALAAGKRKSTIPLERSQVKLVRALAPFTVYNHLRGPTPLAHVVADSLNSLEAMLEVLNSIPGGHSLPVLGEPTHRGRVEDCSDKLSPALEAVCLPGNRSRRWLVLKRPVNAQSTESILQWSQMRHGKLDSFVVEAVLRFYLRHVNPIMYYGPRIARSVQGADVIAAIAPPSDFGLRRLFSQETAHFLKLPLHLASEPLADEGLVNGYRKRLHRLYHFLDHSEVLLQPDESAVENSRSLLELQRSQLPVLVEKLARSSSLSPERTALLP